MARTLAFPVRLTEAGGYRMVEQGSDAEIVGAARMALLCPQGHRPLAPEYGRPYLEFTPARLDRAGLLRAGLERDEPRIGQVADTETVDALLGESVVTLEAGR